MCVRHGNSDQKKKLLKIHYIRLFQVLDPKKKINVKNLHVVVSLCIMIIQVYFFPLRFNGTTAAVAIVDCVPYFGDGWQCARDQIEDLMDWDPGC